MMMNSRKTVRSPRGVAMMYVLIMMVTMIAVCSLAVDLAHVQMCKSQLRESVDAAARYGALGLDTDTNTAIANAVQSGVENQVDLTPLVLDKTQDIFLGSWNTTTHTFTQLSGNNLSNANAVRIIGRRTVARNSAIKLTFASVLGQKTCNLNGTEAIAMLTPSVNVNQNVLATANPFLSGMPYGSEASNINPHHNPDYAGNSTDPRESPMPIAMSITGGQPYNFDSIDGDARHDPSLSSYSPDGDLSDIGHNILTTNGLDAYGNTLYPQNGMTDLIAPINALVGVFLDDNAPNTTPVPNLTAADLAKSPQDFSTAAARNMTTYQPKLKQIFFIGDGKTDAGVPQNFVAPKGATRLFLATWDYYEWNNNSGSRNIQVSRPAVVTLVK